MEQENTYPKTDIVVVVVGLIPVALGAPCILIIVVPRSAAQRANQTALP